MKNDLYIQIPTPCHENWNAMTPEKQGRYCGSCAKTVVDFSVLTDNEVLNYLNKNRGNTCGHFATDQLQRPIIETQLQPKKAWRYWIASFAALLVLMQKTVAQQKIQKATVKGKVIAKPQYYPLTTVGDIQLVPPKQIKKPKIILCSNEDIMKQIALTPIQIEGVVLDETAMPIAFATITTKEKLGITNTDSAGKFFINTKKYVDSITLTVTCIGYETKELTVDASSQQLQTIQLKKKAVLLPEVTVIGYGRVSCYTFRVGGFSTYRAVSKLDTIPLAIAKIFKNEAFTIYPNPIAKNGTINMAVKIAGNYEVQVLSNQSKLLYSQQHNTQSSKQTIQFAVPSGSVSGMYYVRLINTTTKKQWVDKLMIQ